jgi:ribonuclease P protein component
MAQQTFSRAERIRKRADFQRILKEGVRCQGPHFRVSIRANALTHSRLGVTVGKRVGPAVERNRVKRRIREFFRLNKESLPGPSDLVVTAREGSAGLSFWQISEELKGLLRGR